MTLLSCQRRADYKAFQGGGVREMLRSEDKERKELG